jgi:ParB-like chromosome segregation protein Spo0J
MSCPHPPFYKSHFEMISIEKIIDPDIWNLDVEPLINDIKKNGLKEPLYVVKVGDLYRVEDGNHRQRALKKLGWKIIPCIVLDEY